MNMIKILYRVLNNGSPNIIIVLLESFSILCD